MAGLRSAEDGSGGQPALHTEQAPHQPLLSLRGLTTHFATPRGTVRAVDGLSLDLWPGEMVGLVGESGSGKSVTALSVLRLIEPPGRIVGGSALFEGRDLLALPEAEVAAVRGRRIAMVFQNPRGALNPVMPVGEQIARVAAHHRGLSRPAARGRALELLEQVQVPEPARRARAYPHELSGGMCQRVTIALALAGGPALLLADEPTTGLDVTIQAAILDLLRDLQRAVGLTVVLVTHDLGLVAETCDRIAVMHAGHLVEVGTVRQVFAAPAHPYTVGLLSAIPRIDREVVMASVPGDLPSLLDPPPGCRFAGRCDRAENACLSADPPWIPLAGGHRVFCRLPDVPALRD
jgi:oligopeptide/dipeptide ABC transporter ATP-binding protein